MTARAATAADRLRPLLDLPQNVVAVVGKVRGNDAVVAKHRQVRRRGAARLQHGVLDRADPVLVLGRLDVTGNVRRRRSAAAASARGGGGRHVALPAAVPGFQVVGMLHAQNQTLDRDEQLQDRRMLRIPPGVVCVCVIFY